MGGSVFHRFDEGGGGHVCKTTWNNIHASRQNRLKARNPWGTIFPSFGGPPGPRRTPYVLKKHLVCISSCTPKVCPRRDNQTSRGPMSACRRSPPMTRSGRPSASCWPTPFSSATSRGRMARMSPAMRSLQMRHRLCFPKFFLCLNCYFLNFYFYFNCHTAHQRWAHQSTALCQGS